MHPYIYLFGIEINSYSLLVGIACIAALLVALLRRTINQLSIRDLILSLIMSAVGFYFGAKLLMVFSQLPVFWELQQTGELSFSAYYNQVGFAFWGGYVGALLMLLLFHKLYKLSFWQLADSLLPSLLIFLSIAKIGCFMAGCCYGIPWAHGVVMSASAQEIPRVPVQLYESIASLVLFVSITLYGRIRRPAGKIFGFFSLGYGSIRFLLEFLRDNVSSEFVGPFSVAQWFSLASIVIGILFFFVYPKRVSASVENTDNSRT